MASSRVSAEGCLSRKCCCRSKRSSLRWFQKDFGVRRVVDYRNSGRGAAWLARLLGVQEVPGSNPGGPTKVFKELQPGRPSKNSPLESISGWQHKRCRRCSEPTRLVVMRVVFLLIAGGVSLFAHHSAAAE